MYKKGKLHIIPDALSRNENAEEPDTIYIVDITPENDPDYVVWRRDVQVNPKKYPNQRVMGGKIYKKCTYSKEIYDRDFEWKLCVPKSDIEKVLYECHSSPTSPHFGNMKTLEKVRLHYYWPGMLNDVKEYVAKCNICASVKYPNFLTRPPMQAHSIPRRKFEVICVDFGTDLIRSRKGNTSFFVAVDLLTKYPLVYPSKRADSDTMCDFLEAVFLMFGVPRVIISDNGKQFVSKNYQELLQKWKIKSETTPYYHPQSNPAERVIRVIKTSIRAFSSKSHHEWDEHLHEYIAGIRSAVHETTKFTPYFMLFGQEMYLEGNYLPIGDDKIDNTDENVAKPNDTTNRIIQEAKKQIKKAQLHYKEQYDKHTRPVSYKLGEHIYRRNFKLSNAADKYSQKLADQWINSEIIEVIGDNIYLCKDFDGKTGKYHAKDLKPGLQIIGSSRRTQK